MLWRSKSALLQKSIVELVDATKAEINFIHGLINNKSNIINNDHFIVSNDDIEQIKSLLKTCIEDKADKDTFDSLYKLYAKKIVPCALYSVFNNLITDDNKKIELQTIPRPLMQKLTNLQELYFQKFSFYDDVILPIKNVFNWIITTTINFILRREVPIINSNVQEQLKGTIADLSNVTPAIKYSADFSKVAANYDARLIHSNINQNTQNNPFGQPKEDDVENRNNIQGLRLGNGCTIS